jgi:hypothetical protein
MGESELTINRLCGVEGWVESNRGRSCKPRGRFAGRQLGLGSTVHRHQDRNWSRRLGRDPHQWGYYRQTHLSNLPPFPTSYLLARSSERHLHHKPHVQWLLWPFYPVAFVPSNSEGHGRAHLTLRLCFTAEMELRAGSTFEVPELAKYYRSKSRL